MNLLNLMSRFHNMYKDKVCMSFSQKRVPKFCHNNLRSIKSMQHIIYCWGRIPPEPSFGIEGNHSGYSIVTIRQILILQLEMYIHYWILIEFEWDSVGHLMKALDRQWSGLINYY